MRLKVEGYIREFYKLFTNIVHQEFSYLKKKNSHFQNKEFNEINELIKEQKNGLRNIIRHLNFFEKHLDKIAQELGFNFENNEQLMRFNELMFKEHLFCGFILSHTSNFIIILDKQLKSIENSQRFFGKLRYGSLQTHLEREEELYNEFLKIFIEKIETIEKLIQYEKRHEHFQKIEQYVLTTAISITAVPLGPLEFASIPFWGAYFSIEYWKKHSSEFEQWRVIEKKRIIKRKKSPDKFWIIRRG